jgi:hypothetical protein
MANVTITEPQGSTDSWDVDCDGVKFSVALRRVEPNDPRLKEYPTETWSARVTRPDGMNETRYGKDRELAFTKAAGEMRGTRKLEGVDWAAVMRALCANGAFP